MTVMRSILLAVFFFWPMIGWTQVFTSPQPGMLRGVGMMPEMQRGFVSPGLTVGPQNRGITGSRGAGFPSNGSEDNAGSNDYPTDGSNADAMNDPRFQYGPTTEGYPSRSGANEQRRDLPGQSGLRLPGSQRKPLSMTMTRHSPTASGGYFGILGAIGTPAVYFQKADRIPLVDLVKLAGGTTEQASGSVRIVRQGRGGLQTFLSETSQFEVLNGDIVHVDSQRLVTQAGLQEFNQSLRGANNGPRGAAAKPAAPDRNSASATKKLANPAQGYLAFVGLAVRPIVVPVPADEATLTAAMLWLKQDQKLAPLPRVLSPVPLPRAESGIPIEEQLLPSGTVLVFEPRNVNRASLPDFPPVIGETPDAGQNGVDGNEAPGAGQQDLNSGVRVQGPVPGQYRTTQPGFRTNAIPPRTTDNPSRERDPVPQPTERGPQRPRPKSAVIEQPAIDTAVDRPDEVSFEKSPKQIQRGPSDSGPMLFSPNYQGTDRPHVHSPEDAPRSGIMPRPGHQRVTPADVSHRHDETATPAAYDDDPATIPQGPRFVDPAGRQGGFEEPRRLSDDAVESGTHLQHTDVQNDNLLTSTDLLASEADLARNTIPAPSPAPWYSSTIGMVWLTSCAIILVLSGLWLTSRMGIQQKFRKQAEPLDDLLRNHLPVTQEAVRPPLGLRFHGRPQPQTAADNSLPAPHLAQSLFRQSPVEAPLQSAPAVAAVPPKMTIPPVANPEAGMPQPVRSISEQERNLRAEFHQALLDRDRRTPASSNNTISPVETAEIGAPPAPHFVPRPKILANVPRVNLTAQAGDSSISATDDSSVLGRALTHRKSNK